MAGYDRDEVPTLSDTHPTLVDESLDSQSQAYMSWTRSMSSLKDGDMDGKNWKKFLAIWKKFFIICCLVAIFLDPLFFLLLSVQQDNKCIAIHRNMTKTIVAFRSLTDFVYLLNRLLKFWRVYGAPRSRLNHPTRTAKDYLNDLVDLVVVLPLPQIMVLLVLPKYLGANLAKSSGANLAKDLIITAVLIQYIPRLFRFLPLLVGLILEAAWANFFINLFTFVLSGHVIGSWWYLFGLQRVRGCLRGACNDTDFRDDCIQRFIDCGDVNARYNNNGFGTNSNWTSWRKNENAIACFSGDSFEYGIFKLAVNLTSKDITTRYVFSVFWGFQQISTLAGNQQPSYFVWEVLFNMLIIGLGLLLFAFLIGNMQNFLQALDRRKLEFSLRQRDLKQWMRHRSLPKPLKKRVRAAEKYNWEATRRVNERRLIENLPEDIQKDIKRHMFKFVKKVPLFALMDQHILDAICGRLNRTIYIKGCEIYPGGVVDKMVFIIHGKLESIGDDRTVTLREGSVCGEELLTWFLEHASVSKDGKKIKVTEQRLLSNRTVRCLSNVEVFSLRAADLEEVTDYFASLENHKYKNHKWMRHPRLPQPLKTRMRAAENCIRAATKGVNEGMLIENFPEDIQRDIRRHLFKSFKTVWIFALMDQHILEAICERLKQTIYNEGSEILYPGGVVDKMVFIVRGNLESIGDDRTVTPLCEGSVCGEELLPWFHAHATVSKDGKEITVTGQPLLSNRTVRCLSNVEAFLLGAADLEEVTHHFASLKKT